MSRSKHRNRLVAQARAKGCCPPPPKPGSAERHHQHQLNRHANYVRKVWLRVVRDDKVSYRQRMDAELARREAEHQSAVADREADHQSAIADLKRQLAGAHAAAERNAEEAAHSTAEAACMANEAVQFADLKRQVASANAAAERNAERAARSAAEAVRMAHEAAQVAKRTQTRHTENRHALHNAISTVNDLAASALAEEKTTSTTRSLDAQLTRDVPASRKLFASALKMRNADREWNRAVYYY